MSPDQPGPTAASVAIVTGAAGEIGNAIVRALTELGAAVAGLDLRPTPGAALSLECDVTEPAQVAEAVNTAVDQLGAPNRLVCSAGIVSEHPIGDLRPDEWKRVVDVSLTSAYLAAHNVAPRMTDGGAILTVSSGWGTRGYPNGAHYAAAKAGIEALTKSLALELAPRGIRANCVAPGPIRTQHLDTLPAFDEQARAAAIPLGRIGEVDDVVGPALFLLTDQSCYVTGQVLHVNGGLLMP
ncbi:MAG TPA: SDR family NAD(P)-dependent oxidoreductase [Conexibacter sp.]|jgi:NAD(P)-dependent dehydrogenase (short-subunit alcohol dehydrogenase family)